MCRTKNLMLVWLSVAVLVLVGGLWYELVNLLVSLAASPDGIIFLTESMSLTLTT